MSASYAPYTGLEVEPDGSVRWSPSSRSARFASLDRAAGLCLEVVGFWPHALAASALEALREPRRPSRVVVARVKLRDHEVWCVVSVPGEPDDVGVWSLTAGQMAAAALESIGEMVLGWDLP